MRGKIIEDLKYQFAILPAQRTADTTLYNGETSGDAVAIDTRDYDELNIVLNKGVTDGASIATILMESNTDLASGATAVTSGTFTAVTSANDLAIETAAIKCKNYKRYMWVRTVQSSSGTSNLSALAILGKAGGTQNPAANSPIFDL